MALFYKSRTPTNGVSEEVQTGSGGAADVNLLTALNKDTDSIDVAKMSKGAGITTHNAVVAGSTVQADCRGFNSVIVLHTMTGQTTGGWVKVCNKTGDTGTQLPTNWSAETNFGLGVKTANSATDYSIILRGVTDYIDVVLARADGTHTVKIIPINL